MNSEKHRILIIEDDEDISRIQVFNLKACGMEVRAIPYGGVVFQEIRTFRPDLIILDIMLPDVDGFEILKALRARNETAYLPVIIITAKDYEADRIRGLELGADDYMIKPFSPKEMVLRVKAVLKRTSKDGHKNVPTEDSQLKKGPIEIRPSNFVATISGKPVELTRIEFRLLEYFVRHPEMVHTRETLMEHVWGYTHSVYSRTVDTHVRRLRQKMGKLGNCIKTIRGVGYKFQLR